MSPESIEWSSLGYTAGPHLVICFIRSSVYESESASCSVLSDSVTPWTAARQAPLSTGFSRQEYWGGLSLPSIGDLPNPGIEPGLPHVGRFFTI